MAKVLFDYIFFKLEIEESKVKWIRRFFISLWVFTFISAGVILKQYCTDGKYQIELISKNEVVGVTGQIFQSYRYSIGEEEYQKKFSTISTRLGKYLSVMDAGEKKVAELNRFNISIKYHIQFALVLAVLTFLSIFWPNMIMDDEDDEDDSLNFLSCISCGTFLISGILLIVIVFYLIFFNIYNLEI